MPEYETTADKCGHEHIHYHEMDVSEPGQVYEEWHCEDCGAGVITVYKPTHRIIDPRDGDDTEIHTEEVPG